MDKEIIKKNNKKKKRLIIIIGIILVIGIGLFIILNRDNLFKNNNISNNIVANDNKPIVENIKVESDDEIIVVSSRIEKMDKNFSILDKDNQELLKTDVEIVKRLEIGDEVEFQVSSKKDINEAFKYIVKRVK